MVKIVGKITRKLRSLLYAIPFGMKAGDEILATSNTDINEGTSIQQKVQAKNVYGSLLQGEVTQEVEELRYGMYKAEEKSLDYKYVGNGQAIKTNDKTDEEKKELRKHFTQPNLSLEYGVKEAQEMAESNNIDVKERKIFNICYNNPNTRFKFETHMEKLEINIKGENKVYTKMFIPIIIGDRKRRPFINALKRIIKEIEEGGDIKALKKHNEILEDLKSIHFNTYKASNNVPDGIEYKFEEGVCQGIEVNTDETYIVISHVWYKYYGGQLLSERYYSESKDKKYKNKEKKENYKPTVHLG